MGVAIDRERAALHITGGDAETFLQGLWSNDVTRANDTVGVYAAFLTPQGKCLADGFIWRDGLNYWLDVPASEAEALVKRLTMYKLRSDVSIVLRPAVNIYRSEDALSDAIVGGPDPRATNLGFRSIGEGLRADGDLAEYLQRDLHARAPRFGVDFKAGEAFILEYDFERLNGVDFRKGCYVGQEVTARMRHKTALRRGLFLLEAAGINTGDVVKSDGKSAGEIGLVISGKALALLRKDRASGALTIRDIAVKTLINPGPSAAQSHLRSGSLSGD